MAPALEDVVIVGIGETALGKLPGRTPLDLQAEAVYSALRDVGIEREHVDGVMNLDPYMAPESMFALTLAEYLGLHLKFVQTLDVGGTVTVMRMFQTAVWAIATGECSMVVCTSGETVYSGRKQGSHSAQMENHMAGYEWEEPVGVRGMVIPYALLAQHYSVHPQVEVVETDLACIFYTGGTTGKPKGVMLSQRNLVDNAYGKVAMGIELRIVDDNYQDVPIGECRRTYPTWSEHHGRILATSRGDGKSALRWLVSHRRYSSHR